MMAFRYGLYPTQNKGMGVNSGKLTPPVSAVPLVFQGMTSLLLECIDRLHVYSSAAHFAEVAGKEAGEAWRSILNSLYELLGEETQED